MKTKKLETGVIILSFDDVGPGPRLHRANIILLKLVLEYVLHLK